MTHERHTDAALLRHRHRYCGLSFRSPTEHSITMNRTALFMLCAGVVAATAPDRMLAHGKGDWSFQRVGTFANYKNAAVGDATVSEIIAATADGKTLIYTDALRGTVGFIDIKNPARPQADGTVTLDPDPADATTYSPTSVDILGNRYALVTVDTSPSKAEPERPAAGHRHRQPRDRRHHRPRRPARFRQDQPRPSLPGHRHRERARRGRRRRRRGRGTAAAAGRATSW